MPTGHALLLDTCPFFWFPGLHVLLVFLLPWMPRLCLLCRFFVFSSLLVSQSSVLGPLFFVSPPLVTLYRLIPTICWWPPSFSLQLHLSLWLQIHIPSLLPVISTRICNRHLILNMSSPSPQPAPPTNIPVSVDDNFQVLEFVIDSISHFTSIQQELLLVPPSRYIQNLTTSLWLFPWSGHHCLSCGLLQTRVLVSHVPQGSLTLSYQAPHGLDLHSTLHLSGHLIPL